MRDELKYLLPVEALPDLRCAIRPYVELDEHGVGYEERGYSVRSIYLDSPALLYYHEKQGHLQCRKKIRVRGYNRPCDDLRVFLEIKRKNDAAIEKERARLRYRELDGLFRSGDYASYFDRPGAAATARRFLYHVYRHDLRPTALVVYEREAFEGRFDDTFRITLDRNLRGRMYPSLDGLYHEDGLEEAMAGWFVMEVKFDVRMPAWMRQVIAEFGLVQRAVSKYCLSVDAFERRIDTRTAVLACAARVDMPERSEAVRHVTEAAA